MATRLYTAGGTPAISPDVASGWDVGSGSVTRVEASRSTSAYSQENLNAAGTGGANEDRVLWQMIYGPIDGTQITGTVKGQFFAREVSGSTDARAQIVIRVIAPNGTTVRGTLLDFDTAALSSEFNISASAAINRQFPRGGAQSVSTVTPTAGDYIVIEVGWRNHGTNTSNVRILSGETTATTDLPENETQGQSGGDDTYRGWVEFSQTIATYEQADPTAATGTGAANNPGKTVAPTLTAAITGTGAAHNATASLLPPARSVTINGVDLTDKIRWDSFEFTECANQGEVGTGRITVDDTAGTLDIPALKTFTFLEPQAGTSNQVTFVGYTHDRQTQRGPGKVAGQREIFVEALDLNTLADDLILTDAESADRPAETDFQRVAWLLTSRFNSVANVSTGIVPNTNTVNLDAMDFRGRLPRELLNQCAEAAGKNWFIYYHTSGPLLFYDKTSGTNLSTTSKISDVLADVDSSTVWAPGAVTVHRTPDDIYSTVRVIYTGGTETVTNATTASNYRTREISITDMSIESSAAATVKANAFLAAAASERIRVEGITIMLPAANVNDFRAGQRCEIKLTRHGINSYTYYRILRRVIRPMNDVMYRVDLTLSDQVLPVIFGNPRGGDVYGIWERKSNATEDGATVIVDRSGINVIDGSLTLVNTGGTLVIDGESNMFKIAADGTQNVNVTAAEDSDSVSTTLTGLGALDDAPVVLAVHSGSNTSTASQSTGMRTSTLGISFVAATSGGAVNVPAVIVENLARAASFLNGSDQAVVELSGHYSPTASSLDFYQHYYALVEAGF